jgi:hypothetical protein
VREGHEQAQSRQSELNVPSILLARADEVIE